MKLRRRRTVSRCIRTKPIDSPIQALLLLDDGVRRIIAPHGGNPYIEKAVPIAPYSLQYRWGDGERRPISPNALNKLIRLGIVQKVQWNMPDTDIFCLARVGFELIESYRRLRERDQGKNRP